MKILLGAFLIALSQSLRFFQNQEAHDLIVVQTKTPRYYFNQAGSKSQCSLDGMCDGKRKCTSEGKCAGIARPEKSESYKFDQSLASSRCPITGDYNFPIADYFCTGMRKCINGNCK